MQRHTLAGLDVLAHSALADGRLVLLGQPRPDDAAGAAVVWCGPAGQHVDHPDYLASPDWLANQPTMLAHPDGGCLVLPDTERAYWHLDPGTWHEITVTGTEVLNQVSPTPRLQGGTAVSDTADWWVVLGHGQELRFAAHLELDTKTAKARWHTIRTLNPDDFPRDPFGLDTTPDPSQFGPPSVSLTATLRHSGTDHIVSEGSDLRSINRYGADYFTYATLNADGRLNQRRHEHNGWRQHPGKHGIRGRFEPSRVWCRFVSCEGCRSWRRGTRRSSVSVRPGWRWIGSTSTARRGLRLRCWDRSSGSGPRRCVSGSCRPRSTPGTAAGPRARSWRRSGAVGRRPP